MSSQVLLLYVADTKTTIQKIQIFIDITDLKARSEIVTCEGKLKIEVDIQTSLNVENTERKKKRDVSEMFLFFCKTNV